MSWFENQRQAWILETVKIFGFINRSHLMKKFEISEVQASLDLKTFIANNPGVLVYDSRGKRYIRSEKV